MSKKRNTAGKLFTAFSGLLPTVSVRTAQRELEQKLERPTIIRPTSLQTSPARDGRVRVSLQDRWVLLGTTGTGKTTFVKALVDLLRKNYRSSRTYILDSKGGDDFSSWPGVIETREVPAPIKQRGGIQVWRPPTNDRKAYDQYFRQILEERKPAVVVVDELSSLGTANNIPEHYVILLKQGRGLDISVITGTQEAAGIPRQVFGMTTHLVRFNLLDDFDGKKADKFLRRAAGEHGKDLGHTHGFLYRRLDERSEPQYFSSFHKFFGRR